MPQPPTRQPLLAAPLATTLAAAALAAGCAPKNEFVSPPPPEVDVQRPSADPVTVYLEFPGRTQAVARVEVRARVRGFLQSKEFRPGTFVEEDTLLFTIEPDEYQAALDLAAAAKAQADATLELRKTTLASLEKALETNAVSAIEVEKARADRDVASAAVQAAEADLSKAELDLKYTKVLAPTSGRVSRELVDIGNLVGAGDPTLLTTIVRDDPVYVNFEVSERAILPFLTQRPGASDAGNVREGASGDDILTLILANGVTYPLKGHFDFIDNAADPETGTFKARAVFENPDGALADGLFARIGIPEELPNDEFPDVVLVPSHALQRDLQGTFALVLGEGDVVERRIVEPAPFTVGPNRVVSSGLTTSDRVIVSNLQRARDGIQVAPTEIAPVDPGATDAGADSDTDTDTGGDAR